MDIITQIDHIAEADDKKRLLHRSDHYDAFMVLNEQRMLEESGRHVAALVDSMKQHGYIRAYPIVVREVTQGLYEIVDGQHRFQAAKNLNIPFYYLIDNSVDIETVRHLARTTHKWTLDDYVTSQVRQGNQDYIRLRSLRMKSGMNWEAFLRGNYVDYRSVRIEIIKGKFLLTERKEQEMEKFLERFEIFKTLFPEGWHHRHFVASCAALFSHPKYDHEQMKARLEYQSTLLVRCPDTEQYVKLLGKIYNYRSHASNILQFEYKRHAQ